MKVNELFEDVEQLIQFPKNLKNVKDGWAVFLVNKNRKANFVRTGLKSKKEANEIGKDLKARGTVKPGFMLAYYKVQDGKIIGVE